MSSNHCLPLALPEALPVAPGIATQMVLPARPQKPTLELKEAL
jgi:hypothetical protein